MSMFTSLRIALDALLVNKGRTCLTSLGIVIGISAVIALVSAGEGARYKLDERLDSVGKNLILIRPGARTAQGMVSDSSPLTHADAEAIRKQVRSLLVGVAESQTTQRVASNNVASWGTSIVGVQPDLTRVRGWEIRSGRFVSDEDLRGYAPVCLLGETVRRKLFPQNPNPLGQAIRIDRLQMRVIGILAEKGRSITGADQDDQVFVPLTTLQTKLVGEERLNAILTSVADEALLDRAKAEIGRVLREKHGLKAGEETFDVSSVHEIASLALIVTKTLQILIAIIASISLVVGGIGIMNIMLVSVTERTKEIGLRMALGATPANVLLQFLIESAVLALAGGLIGIGLGIGAAYGLALLVKWPLILSPTAIMLACGVSAVVGIFFGYYPAWKASRLNPIEALRYE